MHITKSLNGIKIITKDDTNDIFFLSIIFELVDWSNYFSLTSAMIFIQTLHENDSQIKISKIKWQELKGIYHKYKCPWVQYKFSPTMASADYIQKYIYIVHLIFQVFFLREKKSLPTNAVKYTLSFDTLVS